MKYPVYNQEGKETGEINLPENVFEVPMNRDLVHQVLLVYQSNQRQGSAHAKNRGEVRGGGRKPWRQKGTGRARHGSIRSPLWKGGGVTFGPRKEKIFQREIPKKMKRKAMCMVLSEKAKNNLLVVLEDFGNLEKSRSQSDQGSTMAKPSGPKTRIMAEILRKLPAGKASRLVLYSNGDNEIYLAVRNISKTGVLETRNLNIVDLLNYKYVLLSKDGIKEIKSTFSPKK